MILHTQPTKKWSTLDFTLLEAYQTIEDERCPQCGKPIYVCHTEDPRVQFHIIEDTCAAKEQVEMHEKRKTDVAGYVKPMGTIIRNEAYMTDDSDLTTLREPYYKAEFAKREATKEKAPQ